jgi:hypothetical protein
VASPTTSSPQGRDRGHLRQRRPEQAVESGDFATGRWRLTDQTAACYAEVLAELAAALVL